MSFRVLMLSLARAWALLAAPLAAEAQPAGGVSRIGFLAARGRVPLDETLWQGLRTNPSEALTVQQLQAPAQALGLTLHTLAVREFGEFEGAFGEPFLGHRGRSGA